VTETRLSGSGRYRVVNLTRGKDLATNSRAAVNMLTRGFGLLGKNHLPEGEGLIIRPCNSVVSFFMRFPIDVMFVDGNGKVAHMVHTMRPWRTSKVVRGSKYVTELPAGVLQAAGTEIGDQIEIQPA
jgi:uncharacterized membrane protein (UPF0127 family)